MCTGIVEYSKCTCDCEQLTFVIVLLLLIAGIDLAVSDEVFRTEVS